MEGNSLDMVEEQHGQGEILEKELMEMNVENRVEVRENIDTPSENRSEVRENIVAPGAMDNAIMAMLMQLGQKMEANQKQMKENQKELRTDIQKISEEIRNELKQEIDRVETKLDQQSKSIRIDLNAQVARIGTEMKEVKSQVDSKITIVNTRIDRQVNEIKKLIEAESSQTLQKIASQNQVTENKLEQVSETVGHLDSKIQMLEKDKGGENAIESRMTEISAIIQSEVENKLKQSLESRNNCVVTNGNITHIKPKGIEVNIPIFKDSRRCLPIKFLKDLDQYFSLLGVEDDMTKLLLVNTAMQGEAISWWTAYRDSIRSFEEFKDKFRARFFGQDRQNTLYTRFYSNNFKEGRLTEYFLQEYNTVQQLENIGTNQHILSTLVTHLPANVQLLISTADMLNLETILIRLTQLDELFERSKRETPTFLNWRNPNNVESPRYSNNNRQTSNRNRELESDDRRISQRHKSDYNSRNYRSFPSQPNGRELNSHRSRDGEQLPSSNSNRREHNREIKDDPESRIPKETCPPNRQNFPRRQ